MHAENFERFMIGHLKFPYFIEKWAKHDSQSEPALC